MSEGLPACRMQVPKEEPLLGWSRVQVLLKLSIRRVEEESCCPVNHQGLLQRKQLLPEDAHHQRVWQVLPEIRECPPSTLRNVDGGPPGRFNLRLTPAVKLTAKGPAKVNKVNTCRESQVGEICKE
jgi:hypothetical protein